MGPVCLHSAHGCQVRPAPAALSRRASRPLAELQHRERAIASLPPLASTSQGCCRRTVPVVGFSRVTTWLPVRKIGTQFVTKPTSTRLVCTNALTAASLPSATSAFLENLPNQDLYVWAFCAVGAVAWVKLFDLLVTAGFLEQKLSRKLVHITSGPILVLLWPLFSGDYLAKFVAASIPGLNALRLLLVGSGVVSDPGLVASVSRLGDRRELLKGPLYYCLVLILASILFWRGNPAGIIAISMMCGGDGLADIIGRRFGSVKLPYNPTKSWAGSLAMFIGGMAMAMAFLTVFCSLGYLNCGYEAYIPVVAGICLACTVVESLPINKFLDDNLSVPAVAAILGAVLLR